MGREPTIRGSASAIGEPSKESMQKYTRSSESNWPAVRILITTHKSNTEDLRPSRRVQHFCK